MRYIVTPSQAKEIDQDMIQRQGIPGLVLMERAAAGVTDCVRRVLPKNGSVLILCGLGNNGGDGLAVLRQLHSYGISAEAMLVGSHTRLQGDAKKQYDMAIAVGCSVLELETESAAAAIDFSKNQLVVDALFGTGLQREIQSLAAQVITRLNESGCTVVAVDIPSGIDGATGRICGVAVRAAYTVTFQYAKRGHLFYPGRTYTGALTVVPIGSYDEAQLKTEQMEEQDIVTYLPRRAPDSHKGSYGKALLAAGSTQYAGAAILAATAAVRGGAGLTHVAVPKALCGSMAAVPAAICHPCGGGSEWDSAATAAAEALLSQVNAIAIGPGIGKGEGIACLMKAALATKKPLVLDADALNRLAEVRTLLDQLHESVILTPHPGEMARLTQQAITAVTDDPIAAAKNAANAWGCTVVLKGAVSVIASGENVTINTTGNAGLAKGGSGDVLTGITLALLAQGLTPYQAARTATYLLGLSADKALLLLQDRMMSPMDVTEALQSLLS